ncbi:MAG: glycosyltransferase [Bdellovibrionales bacterium]
MNPQLKSFSVIMATFNSERTIEAALRAIRNQDYPQDRVEILVVDGGSTDATREIAARYECRIIDNPRVDPVNAKLIGLREAKGDYLMHVDSDEILIRRDTLKKRLAAFRSASNIVMVFGSGYLNPPGACFAARYINEYGDPFSLFYYRLSKDHRFFIPAMRRHLALVRESSEFIVFKVGKGKQPIMENAACGNCIDLHFFRTRLREICDKPWGPVHFFYHMQRFTDEFAVTRDDPIIHESAEHWTSLLRKIKSRVRNNIFFPDMAASGFQGRSQFDTSFRRWRRFLYLPYAFLVVPVLIDAFRLAWTRRDPAYMLHVPLTLYTAGLIVAMAVLKTMGYRPRRRSYGEHKVIEGEGHLSATSVNGESA